MLLCDKTELRVALQKCKSLQVVSRSEENVQYDKKDSV